MREYGSHSLQVPNLAADVAQPLIGHFANGFSIHAIFELQQSRNFFQS